MNTRIERAPYGFLGPASRNLHTPDQAHDIWQRECLPPARYYYGDEVAFQIHMETCRLRTATTMPLRHMGTLVATRWAADLDRNTPPEGDWSYSLRLVLPNQSYAHLRFAGPGRHVIGLCTIDASAHKEIGQLFQEADDGEPWLCDGLFGPTGLHPRADAILRGRYIPDTSHFYRHLSSEGRRFRIKW